MNGLRSRLRGMFLVTAAVVFAQAGPPVLAKHAEKEAACNLDSLPSDIQTRLKKDFASWKIQGPENLSENARKTWTGRRPSACPGIATGLFQNAKIASYAVLLVPVSHPDTGYRFLVFSSKAGELSYESTLVEQSDDHGASNYFIRKVRISDFFGAESKKKFPVETTEGIEMIDSAEHEYEADIYFWSNGRFRQEPVDN
jgi:hypothetical protein